MVALVLSLAFAVAPEGALVSAPNNPICKEVWEILWEFQEYTELTDAEIRVIAGSCVDWAEEQEEEKL